MGLFDYLGGATRRKEKLDKVLGLKDQSLRAGQPVQPAQPVQGVAPKKAKRKPFVAPPQPVHIRDEDYPAWVERRKQAHEAQ